MVDVTVSWYDCDCAYISKYCDENHRKYTEVPVELLRDRDAWTRKRTQGAVRDAVKLIDQSPAVTWTGIGGAKERLLNLVKDVET